MGRFWAVLGAFYNKVESAFATCYKKSVYIASCAGYRGRMATPRVMPKGGRPKGCAARDYTAMPAPPADMSESEKKRKKKAWARKQKLAENAARRRRTRRTRS